MRGGMTIYSVIHLRDRKRDQSVLGFFISRIPETLAYNNQVILTQRSLFK